MDDSDGDDGRSRRAYLRALGGSAAAAALAGCSVGPFGGTATPRESRCSSGDTDAAALYDDWLMRLRPGEYDAPAVQFVSARPRVLAALPPVDRTLAPYLWYVREYADAAALPFWRLDRVTTLRPPSERPALYVVVDYAEQRWRWLTRLQGSGFRGAEIVEANDYRGFERRSISDNKVNAVAFDDDVIVGVPKADGDVTADAQVRMERLIDTAVADTHPGHCYSAADLALVSRLPDADFVTARFRTDGGTFGSAARWAPPGARASGLAATFRWEGRSDVSTSTPVATPRDSSADGGDDSAPATDAPTPVPTPFGGGTTPTAQRDLPADPVVDRTLVAAFPEGEAAIDPVRTFVSSTWSATGPDAGPLQFDDPEYEQVGRTVVATETQPLDL